jgi:hypothetical protein
LIFYFILISLIFSLLYLLYILKNLTSYWRAYQWNKSVGIFHIVRKELLEISSTLFIHLWVHSIANSDTNHQWNYKRFFFLMIRYHHRRNYVDIFFVWRAYSFYIYMDDYITNIMTDKTKITKKRCSNE